MGVRLSVRSAWTRTQAEPLVYEFDQARVVVGRAAGADVQLPHPSVSASHASVRQHGAGYALVDESSTNGTRVNGQPLVPGRPKPLRDGDQIELGGFQITIALSVAVAASTSADRTAALARRLLRDRLGGDAALPPPRILVMNGTRSGTQLELPPAPCRLVIGRDDDADLPVPDADASREHAELTRDLDGVWLEDLGSKNGVLVANRRLSDRRRLKDRDEITIGRTVLVFEDPAVLALESLGDEADAPLPPASEMPGFVGDDGDQASATGGLPEESLPEEGQAEGGRAMGGQAARDAESPNGADRRGPDRRGPDRRGTDALRDVSASETIADATDSVPRASRKHASGTTDLIIYLLAGTVLLLSIAGLVYLLRGS